MTRRRSIAVIGLALSLSACDDGAKFWSEDEIRQIASEETQYVADTVNHNASSSSDLKDRVEALENRVEELESENRELKRELRNLSY